MLSLNEASGLCRRLKVCDGNLALLREKLAADPVSYAEEFGEQFEHFQRLLKLLEIQPVLHRPQYWRDFLIRDLNDFSTSVDTILQLCNFLSSTAIHYPEKASLLGSLVLGTLDVARAEQMESEMRCVLCKCIMRLTMARALDMHKVVKLFFELLRCVDKQLRKFVLGALIVFIKRCTKKRTKKVKRRKHKKATIHHQSAQKLQQTLFNMLKDERAVCARVAQLALVAAYRRHYLRNANVVNALSECVFHRVQRIQVSGMRFFLGSLRDEECTDGNSSDEDETVEEGNRQEARTLKEVMQQFRHAKKTRKRNKKLDQAKKAIGLQRKKMEGPPKELSQCNLEAIRAIYDPQNFADRLFGELEGRRRNEKYAIRLLQLSLCARIIGVHRLQTLGFYSHLHRYLRPKQKDVTHILLYAAQACHSLVPPDVVEQLIRVVAQNFVSDRNTPEAITVGLNTIREIYNNCPAAASEEMIRDLSEYKKTRNKNVSMSARALITLLRTINPKLLHHKDRGRPSMDQTIGRDVEAFGETKVFDNVPGAEHLPDDAFSSSCILGDEDFDFIRIQQLQTRLERSGAKRRTNDEVMLEEQNQKKIARIDHVDGLPHLGDIEHFHRKIRHQTKEERMEQVKEGRPDRDVYAKPKKGPHVGRTNRELAKRKPAQMIRQKVRGRNRQRSFRDRQQSLRAYLLRQQGKKVK